jgi:hypothetical protein
LAYGEGKKTSFLVFGLKRDENRACFLCLGQKKKKKKKGKGKRRKKKTPKKNRKKEKTKKKYI